MSNPLAITAVTEVLRNLLGKAVEGVPGTTVTIKPPDKARENESHSQLNLFLYQVQAIDGGGDNAATSSLVLNLHYLVTAYGKEGDDSESHQVLGRAMYALKTRERLQAKDLEVASVKSNLHQQVQPIRIVPFPFSPDELSKLWSQFQTPYRTSVMYQVSAVVIDSA